MAILLVNNKEIEVDGDGFMVDPTLWNEDVMYALAENDGLTLNDEHVMYIEECRAMYLETGVVPSIQAFARAYDMDHKAKPLYELFESNVMERIAKYAACPKHSGVK